MLELTIKEAEYFNDWTNEFFTVPETVLRLEHSLYSISLWESKWCKPFLSKEKKTFEELKHYIKCMCLDNPPYLDLVIAHLDYESEQKIADYIERPMTATWFSNKESPPSRKIITSEIIYYWMIAQNIPMECQYWHLNRLLTLIRVCSIENSPKKKMSRSEEARNRAALNKARRMSTGSKG